MHTPWQDLRYAARSLQRHTVLSVTVLATLTLGIGLNTAVFTLINADTLRPHVDKDPDSFLRIHATYTKDLAHPGYPGKVTLEDYRWWRCAKNELEWRSAIEISVFPKGRSSQSAIGNWKSEM